MKKLQRYFWVGILAMLTTANAWGISKCKDEDGKWHYGDNVRHLCAKAKVTEINNRGVKVNELAAPKTKEELAAEEAKKAEEAKILAEKNAKEKEKERILSIYETEDDIERARSNNVVSLEQQVVVHDAYIKSLGQKREDRMMKIERSNNEETKKIYTAEVEGIDKEVKKSEKTKLEIAEKVKKTHERFDAELALFRKHKNK